MKQEMCIFGVCWDVRDMCVIILSRLTRRNPKGHLRSRQLKIPVIIDLVLVM